MSAQADTKSTAAAKPAASGTDRPLIVLDLGSASRKRIKRLRKGKGKLMEEVYEALDELRSSGAVTGNVQPVVVVVEEDASSLPVPFNLLPVKLG